MDSDGGHAVNLTRNPYIDDHPAWSPDGRWILFERSGGWVDPAPIFVMHPDTSAQHQVGTLEGRMPTWSPDGTQIAYGRYGSETNPSGDPPEILRANADGSDVRLVARLGAGDWLGFQPDRLEGPMMSLRSAYVLVATVVLSLACAQAGAAPPALPVRNGDVLYSKQLVKPTGTALDLYANWFADGYAKRLTRTPKSHEFDAAASPDGRLIAYTRILLRARAPRSGRCARTGATSASSPVAASPPGHRTASASSSSARASRACRSPRSTSCAPTARTSGD